MKFFTTFSEEKGVSLIMTIAAGMFLSILGYITISAVIIDNRIAVSHLQSVQAFWIAESGIELAYRWLRFQEPPPGGTAPFVKYDHTSCGVGTYTVTIDPDDNNTTTYLKKYKLTSVGEVDNVLREIEVEMEMTTFNKYAYLTGNEGGTIWFNTGDVIEGPIHSNDQISIVGSPVFMGKVTSTANSFNQGSPFNPDFQEGYQLGVPPVIFPTQQDLIDNYWAQNTEPPQLVIDARFGKDASIDFNADGTLTYNVWHWEDSNKVYDIQDAVVNIATLNGLVYVKGDVRIKGTLDGVVTVVSTSNMYITDDIVYEMSDANGQPLPGSDDMLGLISLKNVIITDNTPNRDDVIINAAILTLDESFTVQNYDSGSERGQLTIWGSLSQKVRGPVGTFGWWGYTGYQKDYHYDNRFIDSPPPYYPSTGQYHYNYWKEVTD
jgi:cytoskeletal protein CcmA (bactofilin family)